MGCNETAVSIASQNTGNPPCTGYELRANLDFDTNPSDKSDTNPAGADSGDTYWNDGKGWLPIGGTYTGSFDGNADSDTSGDGGPYTISNLFIDRTAGSYAGLFAYLGGGRGALVEDVALVNVDVTLNATTINSVYVGGLAGIVGTGGVTIEDSYTTGRVRAGESSTNPVTFTLGRKVNYVGGLVGGSGGDIVSSYSLADVTGYSKSTRANIVTYAGGLAGLVGPSGSGSVSASYAGGDVSANTVAKNTIEAFAGGLVGRLEGSVSASYARGDASASNDATDFSNFRAYSYAGGLVGYQAANVTASFSTGAATATGDGTNKQAGGLVGHRNSGTTTDSYWDTSTSSITATGQGTGKTTSELQTPTAYGTGTSIYKDWNLDFDSDSTNDDPWAFGTASQYPVLKYGGQTESQQRVTVTLTASPTTIWERALTTPSRVNQSTLTVTPGSAWDKQIVITAPTNASAYTLGASTFTFNAGSTTAQTTTMTAVNNLVDAANNAIALILTADSPWVTIGTTPTVTINDDDEFAKPTGLKLSVDGTNIQADWDTVTGATGYRVEWNVDTNSFTNPTGTADTTGGSSPRHVIRNLTPNKTYYVRVLPTKSGVDEPPSDVASTTTRVSAGQGDYDVDNDGLIEIKDLAQLNAIRWDLDGNGVVDDATNKSSYNAAFSDAEDNMGCNETAVTIASGPGNPACTGYELAANLNLNASPYNSGAGWTPIGDATTGFTGEFDGNNDSESTGDGGPYSIANLFINASSTSGTSYAGLFGVIGAGADVYKLTLTDADVTGSTTADAVYVGALAGKNSGTITESWSLGSVEAHRTGTGTDKKAYAGGLVGWNDGVIRGAYSRADVTASSHDENEGYAGGLVGLNDTGDTIAASYATGGVTANRGTDTTGAADNDSHAGGLVAVNKGTITASYAIGDGTAVGKNTDMGGLVAENDTGATISASYSLGKQSATTETTGAENKGGFAGSNSGTINNGYWDKTTSEVTAGSHGTGKTTSELQAPTNYGTGANDIYKDWKIDVDSDNAGDQFAWNFGTSSQYPVLVFRSLVANKQRNVVEVTAAPTGIWERASTTPNRQNTSTITAVLDHAWEEDLTVALPTSAANYTLNSTTIKFAAGSTTASPTSVTLTAVDDTVNQTSPDSRSVSLSATDIGSYVVALSITGSDITIHDDDNVAKVTGLKLSVDGTKIQVDWTAAAGADGYKVQWNTSDSWGGSITGSATIASGSTVTHKITSGLSANTTYYFRVIATRTNEIDAPPSDVVSTTTKANAADGDHDDDNDGLIEITNLAQLNAVRWDLDGNGVVDDVTNQTSYADAFPNAEDNMGCNENIASITAGTGNPPCTGYELAANLDFDTSGDGIVNASDYVDLNNNGTQDTGEDAIIWNGGAGWLPIGMASASPYTVNAYTGDFDGNSDTDASGDGGPYAISNLFIDRTAGTHAGLFANLNGGSGAVVEDVALLNVKVTLNTTTSSHVDVGGLAGELGSGGVNIEDSYVTGRVRAGESASEPVTFTPSGGISHVGGLVGEAKGDVIASYSLADVTAYTKTSNTDIYTYAGGLIGHVTSAGSVSASWAGGAVTANTAARNSSYAYAGGLVGNLQGNASASYARGDASASNSVTDTSNVTAGSNAGGLVGYQQANITASFSTGVPTASGDGTPRTGGLVGYKLGGTTTDSYWDTATSDTTTGVGGGSVAGVTGKTTSELRTPMGYTGIYANWNVNVDGVTGNDDPWDFGTASEYPALKYGSLVAAEQRPVVTLSAAPATICETTKGSDAAACGASPVTATTISAALSPVQKVDVVVTLGQLASAYTLSANTITIAAGAAASTTNANVTATAVNNQKCGTGTCGVATPSDNSLTIGGTPAQKWVDVAGAPLTIKDDDILAPVTGVTATQISGGLDADAGDVTVSWTKVTGATGYVVQWKSGAQTYETTLSTRSVSLGDVATTQIDKLKFTIGTTYTFRVYATKTGYDDGAPSADATLTSKGWMIFSKTSLSIAEPASGTATETYTVKLASQPTANVTVAIDYREPELIITPASVTFTSANWNQWHTFTVEADQYPPRGTGRNDWTRVTFSDTTNLDFRVSTQVFLHHGKITFQVKRKSDPSTATTVDLTTLPAVTVPSTHQITASPTSLSFTTANWSTPQTVTLSAPADTHGMDEGEVFLHTTTSTQAGYNNLTGQVAAKQVDRNAAPTSASFTYYVDPRNKDVRTMVNPGDSSFQFADADGDTKYSILIVTLPEATQGELKLYKEGKTDGPCLKFPHWARCQPVETPVFPGQFATAYSDPGRTVSVLHFYPTDAFTTSASFDYRMVDNTGNMSDGTYTATLKPFGSVPDQPTGLEATAGNTKVLLTWKASTDLTITKYERRYQPLNGQWEDWEVVTIPVVNTPDELGFTDKNWDVNQSFEVRLADEPDKDVEVTFSQEEAVFTPSTLTFTTANWNVDQTVNVKLAEPPPPALPICPIPGLCPPMEPVVPPGVVLFIDAEQILANATSTIVTGLTNGTPYAFHVRAFNANGPSRVDLSHFDAATPEVPRAPKLAAAGGASQVALTWANLNNPFVKKFQTRQREKGVLAAFPGNAKAVLVWDDPKDSTITKWQYSKDNGTTWTDVPSSSATTTTYVVTGLTNATAYTFQVRPVRGATNGTALTAATATPAATATEGWTDVAGSGPTTTSHNVTSGLTSGKIYAFQARAVDSVSPGLHSVWVDSALLPAKPAKPTVTPGDTNVTLSWTDPSNPTITKWQYVKNTETTWKDICDVSSDSDCATVTSFLVTGLTNASPYTFKIRAVNIGGNGPASDPSAVAIPRDPPSKPTGLSATPGNVSVALNWTDPSEANITGYEYQQTQPVSGLAAFPEDGQVSLAWKPPSDTTSIAKWQYRAEVGTSGYGGWADIPSSGKTTTSYAVTTTTAGTKLKNGTQYRFQVRAADSPTPTGGLTASGRNNQVWLSWSLPSNSSSIEKWQYRYKSAGSYGAWTDACQVTHPDPSATPPILADYSCRTWTTQIIGSLTNGTAYTFQMRALDSSDAVIVSPLGGATATPFAAAATLGEVRATPSAAPAWTTISGSGATTVAHTVPSLTNGIEYGFRIRSRSYNAIGPASDPVYAVPAALTTKPTGLAGVAGRVSDKAAVTLSWPTTNAATSWQYSDDDGATWTAIKTTTVGSNHTYTATTGLVDHTSYTFKVRGVNRNAQTGPESDGVTVKTTGPPEAPTALSVVAGDLMLRVSWTAPTGHVNPITGYEARFKATAGTTEWQDWAAVSGSSASTTTADVGGPSSTMINNQEHAVQIRAVNADGKGATSAEVKGTPIAVPAKPTGLTAKTGGTQAFLSWTDPTDSSITTYQMRTRIGSAADIVIGAYAGKKLTLEWTALNNSSITKYQHSNNGSLWQDISVRRAGRRARKGPPCPTRSTCL